MTCTGCGGHASPADATGDGIRRIYRGGFTEFIRKGISALGSLPPWGYNTFNLRIRSLPRVNPKPPSALFWIRRDSAPTSRASKMSRP